MWAVRKFDLPGACVGPSYLLTSAGHNLAASGTACSGEMGYTARATRRLVKCFGRDSCSLACCAPLAASFCCAGSRKGAARVLPLSLGAAPDLCRRGVDEIALNIGEGSGYREHQEPVLMPLSAHGVSAYGMRSTIPNRQRCCGPGGRSV